MYVSNYHFTSILYSLDLSINDPLRLPWNPGYEKPENATRFSFSSSIGRKQMVILFILRVSGVNVAVIDVDLGKRAT